MHQRPPQGSLRGPLACQPATADRPGTLAHRTGHHGRVAEVDDDQLAALRRLRAAFGFVEVIDVIGHDPAAAADEPMQEARVADPGRMPPDEQEQAHALLTGR